MRAAVETAILGVESAHRFGLQSAYVSVLLNEADDDASAAQSTFTSIQSPSRRSDRVREVTTGVIGDAVDLLDQVRTTARRGNLDELQGSLKQLQQAASDLDDLATRLRGGAP